MARYYRKKKTDTSYAFILLLLILGLGAAGIKVLPNLNTLTLVLYGLGFLVLVFGGALLWIIIQRERRRIKALNLAQVDTMTGVQFEHYVGEILKSQGYHVTFTPMSGDYGTDIIARKGPISYSIQLKRYTKNVSLKAVQEAVAAMKMYHCTHAMVVTNSTFTKSAKNLAQTNNCILVDRKTLADWIIEFQNKK